MALLVIEMSIRILTFFVVGTLCFRRHGKLCRRIAVTTGILFNQNKLQDINIRFLYGTMITAVHLQKIEK